MKTERLSKYTGNSTTTLYMAQYLAEAKTDGVDELLFLPGQIECLHQFFHLPVDWNFVIWGIKITVIKRDPPHEKLS